MFKLSETQIEFEDVPDAGKSDECWKVLDVNFARTLPFIEETIEKWNSRTKLISQTPG